jgi:predicted nucleotidyltransferase
MNELVTHNLEKIAELCRKHGVKRLELFGSAARDDFDPVRSDVDFMVEFFPYEPQGFGDKYFVMMRELEELLGRHVDLVEVGCVRNPYVRASIERTKVSIYDAAA